MGNISDKSYRENQKAFYVQQLLFAPENRVLYGIEWKYTVEPGRCNVKINVTWPLRFACWIIKATHINSKYVKLSVDKKNQLDVTFVFFISLLLVAQHVSGNHVPIIRN